MAQRTKARWWVKSIKIVLWTAMAVALAVVASLVITVRVLTPAHLTPIANILANKMLINADVRMNNVELNLQKGAPFLEITVDSLTIVSTTVRDLPDSIRSQAPEWADTLLHLDRLRGGINLAHLVLSKITLSDVELSGPEVNIAIIREDVNNFNIFPPSTEPDTAKLKLPQIAIRRFHIVNPKPLRFIDLPAENYATLSLDNVSLSGIDAPTYKMKFDSNLASPLLQPIDISELPISFNGNIIWNQENIYRVGLENFDFAVGAVSGQINTALDFENNLTVNSFAIDLQPISVSDALRMVPAKYWQGTGFAPSQLKTDMQVKLSAALTQPYVASSAAIPHATLDVVIPQCYARWRDVDLRAFALDMKIDTNGDNIDKAMVKFNRIFAQGPATDITLKGSVTNLFSDPLFDGRLDGHINLVNLPEKLKSLLNGNVSGRLTATTSFRGKRSMLSLSQFHHLKIDGDVDLDNLFYQRNDTSIFLEMNHACLKFDSNRKMRGDSARIASGNLLSASIDVDTAHILHSNIDMRLSDFRIAVGALNDGSVADSTVVIPLGGGIKARTFSLITLTDTFTLRVRDVKGNVIMKRFNNLNRVPQFTAYLNIARISTGNKSTRILLGNSTLRFNTHKLPFADRIPKSMRTKVVAIADSLKNTPDLINVPEDSILLMAMRHYRAHSHTHVSLQQSPDMNDDEVINWDTSRDLTRFLRGWDFKGSLSSDRVFLFSHYFPVRNRMENLKIEFCNDSIAFNNAMFKAGRSDFLLSGKISNIKRALTSRNGKSPLKLNFDLVSDTIDVNQLAKATFDGSAFAQKAVKRDALSDSNEKALEKIVVDHTTQPQDTMPPLLIPVNIEARLNVKAQNVLYADILLKQLSGTVLVYDGAVNLSNIRATSKIGSIDLSALYSAPEPRDMKFGFGLKVNRFNISNFLNLIPAVDSIMPIMRNFSGIIDANIAATSKIDRHMNLVMPSLKANIDLAGDSLVVVDRETFKTIAKWLLFKNKNRNMIDHMSVQIVVQDNTMEVYPFIFDFDRYRLGVQGYNDLDMNFKYHIAVLKSPIPFKFGINISGNPDKYKIRLGGAHFNEKDAVSHKELVETSRINLLNQIQGVFRRGVRRARFADLEINSRPIAREIDLATDTISAADSLLFIQEGLIPQPIPQPQQEPEPKKTKKSRKK